MKTIKYITVIELLFVIMLSAKSQKLSQVVRGQVIDVESRAPLGFAALTIHSTNSPLTSIADEQGYFRFNAVPIGRYDLHVSYLGYEPEVIPELMVTSGKEVVLTLEMKEKISELEEVVVKAFTRKDKALNSMATTSARSFSVEEARRYAGGLDDPARLASSFAGITTESLRDNTIIIRGNTPKGLLWRLEGVEIPNPNHFANLGTFGGGGVSALSALVVDNSDFFTGAFPAEYGNAISGVFDINLRTGNNEQHEHAVQIGSLGLDISSEGPLMKGRRASYLFNYRYSTLGLIRPVLPREIKDFVPVYQDLSFKINMPTSAFGMFSVWGLAAHNRQVYDSEQDSSLWESFDDRLDGNISQGMGAVGFNHRYLLPDNAYINTSIAATGNFTQFRSRVLGIDLQKYDSEYLDARFHKFTLTSVLNKKFSARHSNRTGLIIDNLHYNTLTRFAPVYGEGLITIVDEQGASNFVQLFTQSKYHVSERFFVNAGLHGQYFDLNREFVIEPRLGMILEIGTAQSVGLAYGMHSIREPLILYFAQVRGETGFSQPNINLKTTKSHHLVFSYNISLNPDMRLKIEPYTQFLFDVPVIPDSNYSVLNMEADWYFDQPLINQGTGNNTGIDLTFERFLQHGYYYLLTASLFNSTYKGADGIRRNTRFNTRYVFNVLYGKEWVLGKQDNKILGVNARVNYLGGKRTTPVDAGQSVVEQDVVYDYSRLFDEKESDIFFVSAGVNYRVNKSRHSSILSLQITNLLRARENYGLYYNYKSQKVEPFEIGVVIPNLSYKIEF